MTLTKQQIETLREIIKMLEEIINENKTREKNTNNATEDLYQQIFTLINLFAMDIEFNGYSPKNHQALVQKIVEKWKLDNS